MEPKVTPDEKITMNALDSFDPFARQGQVHKPQPQPEINKQQKDFSHLDDNMIKENRKPKRRMKKNGKILGNIESPTSEQIKQPIIEDSSENVQFNDTLQSNIVESRTNEGLPSYRSEFAGRDIFVGFSANRATNPITAIALINIALDFGRDKIRFDVSSDENNFYKSRNDLAEKFLATDAKWLLLLDNNIIPSIGRPQWAKATIGAARNIHDSHLQKHIVHRLIGAGKSLVGAAYFANLDDASIDCSKTDLGKKARVCTDSVEPVDWVGSGCLLIHRRVLQDIKRKFPDIKHGAFYPDDISFCKKAMDAGHQPHIDLGVPVFNVGIKAY
jgi:hypothetical protein